MARILLLGLDDSVARRIETASLQVHHSVAIEPMCTNYQTAPHADVVFVSGDEERYLDTLRSIRSHLAAPPVVVVTRTADSCRWLNALEAGAADYCSAPFEPKPIQWILASALQAA